MKASQKNHDKKAGKNLGKKAGKNLGKKAVKATARHSWRSIEAKAQRKPLRSVTLLTAGGAVGLMAGYVAGRKTAPSDERK
jgi:hypothetical protein